MLLYVLYKILYVFKCFLYVLYRFQYGFISLFACPSVCLSLCLCVCPPVCLFIPQTIENILSCPVLSGNFLSCPVKTYKTHKIVYAQKLILVNSLIL